MIKVNDISKIKEYSSKYNIKEIFSVDMTSFIELFCFEKNEYIYREEDEVDYLLFFVKGKAKVYITLSNGKSLLLSVYEPFKVIGDMEIVSGVSATTNVQVIEETLCLGISIENVRKYLLDDSKFLRFVCESLSRKLNRSSRNSSINLLYSLENRLASYIIATGVKFDSKGNKIIEFNSNLTEIAELLGTSYRHLLRTLNALCVKGAIRKKDRYYEIVDINILEDLSADLYR